MNQANRTNGWNKCNGINDSLNESAYSQRIRAMIASGEISPTAQIQPNQAITQAQAELNKGQSNPQVNIRSMEHGNEQNETNWLLIGGIALGVVVIGYMVMN